MERTKQTVCKIERPGEQSVAHSLVNAIAEAQACELLHANLDNMDREIDPQGDGDGAKQQENIFKDLENIDVTTHAAIDEAGLLLATRTPIPLFGGGATTECTRGAAKAGECRVRDTTG